MQMYLFSPRYKCRFESGRKALFQCCAEVFILILVIRARVSLESKLSESRDSDPQFYFPSEMSSGPGGGGGDSNIKKDRDARREF